MIGSKKSNVLACSKGFYATTMSLIGVIGVSGSTMNITKKTTLPFIGISAAVVGALQVLLYEPFIAIAQAQFGGVPLRLIMEILLTTAAHSAIISIAPLFLATFNKVAISYAVLILFISIYIQIAVGINPVGPTVAAIACSVLIFYASIKASELIRHFRAK